MGGGGGKRRVQVPKPRHREGSPTFSVGETPWVGKGRKVGESPLATHAKEKKNTRGEKKKPR